MGEYMGTHPIFESDFDCLTEMLVRSITNRPWCFRCRHFGLSRSLNSAENRDDLSWLRPIDVNFDKTFEKLKDKIDANQKSGTEIKNDSEIQKILSQLINGRKPPPKPTRTLKYREKTEFSAKLLKNNPSTRLYLIIFYLKYFPELGARQTGLAFKNRKFYDSDKISADIKFNKRLLKEKFNLEYDEIFARFAVGSPLDARWKKIKNRWASYSDDELLNFEENFRNGKIQISNLPKFSLDLEDNPIEIPEENISSLESPSEVSLASEKS